MKKEYQEPIIEVIELDKEDIIVTSQFDPDGLFNNDNKFNWDWS